MLKLPKNWRSCSAQFMTRLFLQQAAKKGLYQQCSRLLARACVKQLLESWRIRDPKRLIRYRTRAGRIWANKQVFVVLDSVSDDLITDIPRWSHIPDVPWVLTPPGTSGIVKRVAEHLRAHDKLHIQSLEDYCCLRVSFTSLDFSIPGTLVFEDILARYCDECRRARTRGLLPMDKSIRAVPTLRLPRTKCKGPRVG